MNTPYNIDFMGKRRITAMISGVLLVASILSLSLQGLNLGIDFTGGTIVEIGYQQAADLDQVRQQLLQSEFSDAVVQYFGTANDILIRIPPLEGMNSADVSNKVLSMLGDGVEM
ncbi:MAG: protein translocase subunit SecF, partial [Gammaproteobacteria bacterium]